MAIFLYLFTNNNGTVCLGCAATSAMFMPNEILPDVERWVTGKYRKKILGKYGFIDSLNLDRDWYDPDVLGITAGPLYLALANLDPAHSIWKDFNAIPAIQDGLNRAGFHSNR